MDMLRSVSKLVRGIFGVSPEDEKEGCVYICCST